MIRIEGFGACGHSNHYGLRKPGVRTTYGMMYGMEKTTVYLPPRLKAALRRTAAARQVSEATVIRDSIERATQAVAPRPTLPLFHSREPDLAERVDEALAGSGKRRGFGER